MSRWPHPFSRLTPAAIERRDQLNRDKYGEGAPLYCERIWIDPRSVSKALVFPAEVGGAHRSRWDAGTVVETKFPPHDAVVIPVIEVKKVISCLQRWLGGAEWESTQFYQNLIAMMGDWKQARRGLDNPEAILRHCWGYDVIYLTVKGERRLRTREEHNPGNFREERGIVVHVGPGGEIFLGSGNRRYAISRAAGLTIIPAMVGYVHVSALAHYAVLRQASSAVGAPVPGEQQPTEQP
jgi:hypothetical protein